MLWLVFAGLTALFESLKDVFSKSGLKNIDEYIVAWSLRFFALLFLIPILFFIEIPTLGTQFWTALFVGGILNIITTLLYIRAIKHSDLSLTVPMVTFTPLFLLMTSPLLVGEFPNFFGLIGVLLIVAGAYALNIKEKHKGYLAPFKALISETGPKLMLIVAFIFSISSNIDKIGVKNSSPLFWVIAINTFLTFFMSVLLLYKSRKNLVQIKSGVNSLAPIGFFSALTLVFQMTAIKMALVAYVISVKRTSSILTVLFGYMIFREKGIKERLTGTILMVLGVIFIALS